MREEEKTTTNNNDDDDDNVDDAAMRTRDGKKWWTARGTHQTNEWRMDDRKSEASSSVFGEIQNTDSHWQWWFCVRVLMRVHGYIVFLGCCFEIL